MAAARNVNVTHSAAAFPLPTPAKMSANATGSVSAPISINRVRVPVRMAWRSLTAPTKGLKNTSHTLGTTTTAPAIAAATPSTSVR